MSSDLILANSTYTVDIFSSWKGGQESTHNLIDICSEIDFAHSSSWVKKLEFGETNFVLWV